MAEAPATRCTAIVVAAGAGVRMGAGIPKALMPVGGRALAAWCLDALAAAPVIDTVVVVGPPGHEIELAHALGLEPGQVVAIASAIADGNLDAIDAEDGLVLVHDAARPLVRPALIDAVIAAVGDGDGAIAAIPLADTPKRVADDGVIVETPTRGGLWLAQTPQVFRLASLRAAFDAARTQGRVDAATDCASMVEAIGGCVRVVASMTPNLKVTTPADVRIAELLLADADIGTVR